MRLWHYKLLPYLPKSQLLAQWRELNSIFKKQNKHILINYVYEYDKNDLYFYSLLVISEMIKRKISINNLQNMIFYFELSDDITYLVLPNADKMADLILKQKIFENHHNKRYLLQCFFNLDEKCCRGQKDFDVVRHAALHDFVSNEFNGLLDILMVYYL